MNDTAPTQLYKLADENFIVTDTPQFYKITPTRELPADEKPREKLIAHGPGVLKSSELIAAIFGVGTKKEEVAAMSSRIIREYGPQALTSQKNVHKLMADLDIPEAKACQLIASFELGRRFFAPGTGRSVTVRTAERAYEHLQDMANLPKEHLRGLYLNSHYQLIHDEVISIGSVTANIVHPREVFRPALEFNASAVILAHNHPSGNATPSAADHEVTAQIQAAGELLGIELLDHLVIGKNTFTSLMETSKKS